MAQSIAHERRCHGHAAHWDSRVSLKFRFGSACGTVKCLGAMRRSSIAVSTRMTATGMLRPRRKRKDKHYRQKADNSIHESLLHCCTLNSMKTLHEMQ
jgi:hypothetical protein